MLTLLLMGLALWFVLEGLLYAVAPEAMKQFARYLSDLPVPAIRQAGLLSVVLGGICLWLVAQLS